MSDMFDSLQDEMAGLRRELEAVKAERDWAHRELDEWRERHDALFDEALRLKAKWQAEGAQTAADAIRYEHEGEIHRDRIADYVDEIAAELRRQAEEADQ